MHRNVEIVVPKSPWLAMRPDVGRKITQNCPAQRLPRHGAYVDYFATGPHNDQHIIHAERGEIAPPAR